MAHSQFDRAMRLIRTRSLKIAALFFKKDPSTIYRWSQKGAVPEECLVKAEEYNKDLNNAFRLINSVYASQVEIAEEYGVDPLNISKRKKNNPDQYKIIEMGVKMQKVFKEMESKDLG